MLSTRHEKLIYHSERRVRMGQLKIRSFLLIFITHFYRSEAVQCTNGFGKKLPVDSFMVIDNLGMQMCLKECEAFPLCSSINFHRKKYVCELNSVKMNESIFLIDDQDYVYNEISHPENRTCGTGVTCNPLSKCLRITSDKFVCIPVLCANPVPIIPNGYIAQRTYNPPSVTYGCNMGHFGEGRDSIKCVPGKNWETPTYTCKDVCVGPAPEIPNGHIAQRSYNPPSVIYSCNSGYFGEGKNSVSCVPREKWETPTYKCVDVCDGPAPVIPNAYAQKTSSPPSATYTCSFGHYGQGNNFVSCVSGKYWETPSYSCTYACNSLLSGFGYQYCIRNDKQHWTTAKAICSQLNGYLVEIGSASEQSWLASQVAGTNVWIGLTDMYAEGGWVWDRTGHYPQSPQWPSGFPNGGTSENCAILMTGGWDDYPCSSYFPFICKG